MQGVELMKKKIFLLTLVLAFAFANLAFAQDDQAKIVINGQNLDLNDEKIIFKDDRNFVPLRLVCESLGCKVKWEEENKRIQISTDALKIFMEIDKKQMTVNNIKKDLDVSHFIENDRTYVPVRFVAEALGKVVSWKDEDKTIFIDDKDFQGDPDLNKYLDKDAVFKNFISEPFGASSPRLAYVNSSYSVILNYNGILIVDNKTGKLKGAVDNRSLGYNHLQGDDYVKVLGTEDYILLKKNSQTTQGYVYNISKNQMKFYENAGSFSFKEGESTSIDEEKEILDKVESLQDFSYSLGKYPQGLVFLEISTKNLGNSKFLIFDKDLNELREFKLSSIN